MARWTQDRIRQRVNDLKGRLSVGQTLEEIAGAWGTSKQNVSQFRKKYLGAEHRQALASRPKAAPGTASDFEERSIIDDGSLFARAYRMILVRDRLLLELEEQLRELKYRLYTLEQGEPSPDEAKESLRNYMLEHDDG